VPPITGTRLRSLALEIYAEFGGGCAVTGEPAFAFYGRTAQVHGLLMRPVGSQAGICI